MKLIAILIVGSHLSDARVCNHFSVLEEDERVQLHAGAPGHLGVSVADVEVACQRRQPVAVLGVLREPV